jgi:hypothetical protein
MHTVLKVTIHFLQTSMVNRICVREDGDEALGTQNGSSAIKNLFVNTDNQLRIISIIFSGTCLSLF